MKKMWAIFGYWTGAALIWELCLHFTAYGTVAHFLPGLLLTVGLGALLALLTSLPGRWGRTFGWVLPIGTALLFSVQLVYHDIFGSLLSMSFVAGGGDAIGEFYMIVLGGIWRKMPHLLLTAAPVVVYHVLRKKGILQTELVSRERIALAAAAVLIPSVTFLALPLGENGPMAAVSVLKNPNATIDRWAEHFGLVTGVALDGFYLGLGDPARQLEPGVDLTRGEETVPPEYRNILPDMDFQKLEQLTDDPQLHRLNTYFDSLSGTGKNQYTGMFEGYNLIVLCGEAFSGYCIDPELTPALYRMSSEGIAFKNFYNSFPNTTTNGEYSLCMGLMPDFNHMSFADSVDNYLPFALGNIWQEGGAVAYHNNAGTYYNRVETHPNMGYTFHAPGCGLELEPTQPTSDLEMLEKTLPEYIGNEPFHAYYMTYSGHAEYGVDVNAMSAKNWDAVSHLDTTDGVKGYLASQMELEYAMEYLLEQLEANGLSERTVVVLTGDHMPYGMADEDYARMAGDATKEPFWRYRNSFICWTGGLEEPFVVEDYCCTQDILPTLLNLFGLPYDSRLLTGRDVLSDCTHMALLKDGSFLTEQCIYTADTGAFLWKTEPDGVLGEKLLQAVSDQMAVSAAILHTDYYGYAFSTLDLTEVRRE